MQKECILNKYLFYIRNIHILIAWQISFSRHAVLWFESMLYRKVSYFLYLFAIMFSSPFYMHHFID